MESDQPLDEYPLDALLAAAATAAARPHGFTDEQLATHTAALREQLRAVIDRFERKLTIEAQRAKVAAELQRLKGALAQAGSAVGKSIADHREDIAQALAGDDHGKLSEGIRALSDWLRDPSEEKAQSLVDRLKQVAGDAVSKQPTPPAASSKPKLTLVEPEVASAAPATDDAEAAARGGRDRRGDAAG